MKVKIVDKKEDVKEMTIEELANRDFVGVIFKGSDKYLLASIIERHAFISPTYYLGSGDKQSDREAIREMAERGKDIEFSIFDTARDLYLWMAE